MVVVGEAGVGKTTLLRAAAATQHGPVLEGGGLSTLSWMPGLLAERALGKKIAANDPAQIARLLSESTGDGVLIADDLQWADRLSSEAVRIAAASTRVLAAVRVGDPDADPVLDALAQAGFDRVDLEPLDRESVTVLVSSLRPELSSTLVERLYRRTGGNPLLIEELVAAEGEVSDSLRLALAARMRTVSDSDRALVSMLAIAGRPVESADLGGGIDKLERSGWVAVADGWVSLRHALIADVVVENLTDEETRATHARFAAVCTRDGEAAVHHLAAGEDEIALVKATRAAEASTWPHEKATLLAVAAEASGPEPSARRAKAGLALSACDEFTRALDLLGSPDDYVQECRGDVHLARARSMWGLGDEEGARAEINAGIEVAVPGSDADIQLRVERSSDLLFAGETERGLREAKETWDIAEGSGVGRAIAKGNLSLAHLVCRTDEAEAELLEAIRVAIEEGNDQIEVRCKNNHVLLLQSEGRIDEAKATQEALIERARELGLSAFERMLLGQSLQYLLPAGAFDELIERADDLLAGPLAARSRCETASLRAQALVELGRLDEALTSIDRELVTAPPDFQGRGLLDNVKAWLLVYAGRPRDAIALADEALATYAQDWVEQALLWKRAWARFDLGDDPGPLEVKEGFSTEYQVEEIRGLRLLASGDAREAAAIFDELAAADEHASITTRLIWLSGEATRVAGDAAGSKDRLRRAEERATTFKLEPLLARIRRSLRLAGERRAAPRGKAGGLSPREQEVLALVGEGLTNDEVARRLGLSSSTVRRHISNASVKLGASSRHQAALLAGGVHRTRGEGSA